MDYSKCRFRPIPFQDSFLPWVRKNFFWALLWISIFLYTGLDSAPIPMNSNSSPLNLGTGTQGFGSPDWGHSFENLAGDSLLQNYSGLDVGIRMSSGRGEVSPGLPSRTSGYYALNSGGGIAVQYIPIYNRYFPGKERIHTNLFHIGYSWNLTKDTLIGVRIGPGIQERYRSLSRWAPSGSLQIFSRFGNWTWGSQILGVGKTVLEDYREGDRLEESLPVRAGLGMGYREGNWGIYGEILRTFWENYRVNWNGVDQPMNRESGIGPKVQIGLSIFFYDIWENWDWYSGVMMGGAYDLDGRNRRALGIGTGLRWNWIRSYSKPEESDRVSFQLGILDYSRTAVSGSQLSQTEFSFSFSYFWSSRNETDKNPSQLRENFSEMP
jgi:hypothetical protein